MHALKSRIPVSPLLLDSLVSERKADGSPHTEKSSASESGDEGHPTCTLLRKEEESGTESESPSESRKRAPSPLKTVRRTPAASIFQQLNSAIEHESPVSFDSPSVLETTVETVSTLPSQAHGFHHPMAQHEDLDGTAQLFSTAVAHRQNLYQTTLEPPVAEIQAKSRASIIEDLHLQLERSSVSQKAVETKVEQLERRLLNAEKEISRLQNLLEVRKRAVLDLTGPITRLLTLHQQETCERSHQDTIPKDVSPIRLNDIMTAISSTCHSPRFSPSLPTQKIYDDRKHPIVKIQDESDSIAVKKAAEAVPKSHRRNSKHASSSATLAPSGSQLLEFQKSLRQIATTKPNIALETESGQVDYERGGDITGWMYKMNTNGKDVSWTKRFCRLSAESFQYYKRASDNKPRLQAPVLYTNTQVALGKYDRKFAFVLITFEEPNDEAGPAPLPELDVSSILPSLSSPALSPSSALTPISLIPSTSMPSVLQTKVKTTVLSVDNEKDLKKWITAFKRAKKLLIDLRSDLRVADSLKEVAELSQTHSIIDHYQEKIDRLLNRPNPCLSARRTTSEQYHGPSSADDGDFKTASQLAAMAASNSYIGNCEFNLALITSELVNTEQDYGRDLETLDRVFRKRLINSRILPEEELSVIFYNLKELIDLNKSLCDLLERTKMKPRHLQDFGQVFISAVRRKENLFGKSRIDGLTVLYHTIHRSNQTLSPFYLIIVHTRKSLLISSSVVYIPVSSCSSGMK